MELDPSQLAPERPRRMKRAEYDHLVETGFYDDERVELLHGVVVAMSPIKPPHADPVDRLTEWLASALKGRARVRIQQPLVAIDESEPEPDVAVVPLGDYSREHPSQALLVIEVAYTSMLKDRNIKAPLYASSGFPEYWIVNIPERVIEVFRDPQDGTYKTVLRLGRDEKLAPIAFPDVEVQVGDVVR